MVIVLKFSELDDREVFADSFKVGKVKDVVIDDSTWKVTHLVLELTKEASEKREQSAVARIELISKSLKGNLRSI